MFQLTKVSNTMSHDELKFIKCFKSILYYFNKNELDQTIYQNYKRSYFTELNTLDILYCLQLMTNSDNDCVYALCYIGFCYL